MAFNYSPRIVRSGLIWYLDAANTKSYIGSGTAWNDLSSNRYHGTLTNGPTFNNGNGGSIVFDGVDDCIVTSTNTITTVSDFTIDIGIKYNSSDPTFSSIFGYGKSPDANTNFGFLLTKTGAGYYALLSDGTNRTFGVAISGLQNGVNYNMVFTLKSDGNTIGYLNGVQYATDIPDVGFTTIKVDSTFILSLGYDTRYTIGSANRHFMGSIFYCRLYNRILLASEVLQNYNAMKSRFNLS